MGRRGYQTYARHWVSGFCYVRRYFIAETKSNPAYQFRQFLHAIKFTIHIEQQRNLKCFHRLELVAEQETHPGNSPPSPGLAPCAILICRSSAWAKYEEVTPNRPEATCLMADLFSGSRYLSGSSPPSPVLLFAEKKNRLVIPMIFIQGVQEILKKSQKHIEGAKIIGL